MQQFRTPTQIMSRRKLSLKCCHVPLLFWFRCLSPAALHFAHTDGDDGKGLFLHCSPPHGRQDATTFPAAIRILKGLTGERNLLLLPFCCKQHTALTKLSLPIVGFEFPNVLPHRTPLHNGLGSMTYVL